MNYFNNHTRRIAACIAGASITAFASVARRFSPHSLSLNKTMNSRIQKLTITFALTLATNFAFAATVVVPGSANIFGAGFASPPNTGVGGPGTLPPSLTFTAGSTILTFSSVTGSVSSGGFTFGPDGEGPTVFPTNLTSNQGISGARADTGFLLFGVFLDANTPTGTPPATLNFTSSGLTPNFLSVSPTIGQIFYVGDGRTGTGGSGTVQTFQIPNTATRLFLGIADGQFDGTQLSGVSGNYQDNTGSFTATLNIVPEPSSCVFLCMAAAYLAMQRRAKCA